MIKLGALSAFAAALIAGLLISLVQAYTTEPLIFAAERYEVASAVSAESADQIEPHSHASDEAHDHDGDAWSPTDGLQRSLFTLAANMVTAFAIALMLWAGMVFAGGRIDAASGVLWGVAGFAAVALLPSLGLPPELPATPAAALVARQTWWLLTALASAAGIALVIFGRGWVLGIAGVGLLVVPHIIGAPEPPTHEVPYPGALAGEFAAGSLVVAALLWVSAGAVVGWAHHRLAKSSS